MASRREHSQSPDPNNMMKSNNFQASHFLKPSNDYEQWHNHVTPSQMYGMNSNNPTGDGLIGSYLPGFYQPAHMPPMSSSVAYYGNGWTSFYPPQLPSAANSNQLFGHHPPHIDSHHPAAAAAASNVFSGGLFNYFPSNGADYDAWSTCNSPSMRHGLDANMATLSSSAPPPPAQDHSTSTGAVFHHFAASDVHSPARAIGPAVTMLSTAVSGNQPLEHALNRLSFDVLADSQSCAAPAASGNASAAENPAANSSVVNSMMTGGGCAAALGVGIRGGSHHITLGHQISGGGTKSSSNFVGGSTAQQQQLQLGAPQQQQQLPLKKTWASIVKQPDKTGGGGQCYSRSRKIPISGFGCLTNSQTAAALAEPPLNVTASSPFSALGVGMSSARSNMIDETSPPIGPLATINSFAKETSLQQNSPTSCATAAAATKKSYSVNSTAMNGKSSQISSELEMDKANAVSGGNQVAQKNLQTKIHKDEEFSSVLDKLRQENQYNPREFTIATKGARYFVVKSYNEDDFHRSIKYGIWCSTEHGNRRLDQTFRERDGKGPVYIFASVNGSGHFCGVAQMTSAVDYGKSVGVWAQDKYKGHFTVKWVYVKDVPNNQLRHIRLENNENKPVTNSRDTQEVPPDKGRQVLRVIHDYQHTTSLFDDFTHYEKREREEEERKKRSS